MILSINGTGMVPTEAYAGDGAGAKPQVRAYFGQRP